MAAYYDVVDPIGALVVAGSTPPYVKLFQGNANFVSDTMFLIWVKTGYSSPFQAATVRVNGQDIGKLFPRPWLNGNYIDSEAVSLLFPRTVLRGGPFFQSPVYNTLEIQDVPGAADGYVLIEKVFFFRNTF